MQPVAELHRADAVALAREAIILPYSLARSVCRARKLDSLYVVTPLRDDREGGWSSKFCVHVVIQGLYVAAEWQWSA